ncbi:non-heme iron oxygenase ferredoxin subunit [Oscillochloris sp. ZM17-4]|uniref:non-heme iron oxygenase ferredoxin subunit n=1 Tax=Oscillochloris sp. ZM17-4 TaxID=2866714 RepID=UPI001C73711A|nr:non-heme iron oxygenase ferredoxin subunit [Oscillochloris sp. ZM17-4]MBX0328497.1 non-heme iron oxygenase ferredoxin subunit [Oscillochloris sp. ZM17-4]
MPSIQIGSLADVPEGGAKKFDVDGTPVAVFRVGDELFAIDDTCSHAEASLSEGEVDADELCVECPLHGASFDLRSGRPRTLPAFEPVGTYRVWAEGDALFVEYDA